MLDAAASGWEVLPGVSAIPSGGALRVETNSKHLDYQLKGPAVSIPPGHYRVIVAGLVTNGGIDVGVLDNVASSWIVQDLYWYGQFQGDMRPMTAEFSLEQPAEIRVILSNWQTKEASSAWLLRHVSVERVD